MSLADDNVEWALSRLPNLMYEINGGPDEDLQQEALLGFCEAARDWNGKGEFRAYAYEAMRHQVVDAQRKHRRVVDHEEMAGLLHTEVGH